MTELQVPPAFNNPGNSLRRLMLNVIIGLIPGTLAYVWFFGAGVVINIAIAVVCAIGLEAGILHLRNKPVKPHITDNSAIVAAWLFALCLPTHSPWWLIVVGIIFTMTAGKHLYGGLGFNPFNPAMVGYVVLLISFPREMTTWHLPLSADGDAFGWADSLAYTFGLGDLQQWDALTSATPLDQYKTAATQGIGFEELRSSPIFGHFAGLGWEWIATGWLVGGLWLLFSGTIKWHIPVAVLCGAGLFALGFYLSNPEQLAPPLFQLLSGSIILGAFFIATDPVTAATTNYGRLFYGLLIGALVYVIRTWGGYPDGVAFAVLLANMCVPLIDHYTQPKVYGSQ